MNGFNKYREAVIQAFGNNLADEKEVKKSETAETPEEWIWVDGYKGTDRNMTCRDYQFEPNGTYSIPEEEEVKMCSNGFHLCKELGDVFGYYDVGRGHRFFEVRALVRKSDFENYTSGYGRNKLVARTIAFGRELEVDEILEAYAKSRRSRFFDECDLSNWTDDHKKIAMAVNVERAQVFVQSDYLASLGFSKPFAKLVIDGGAYNTAKAVASQEGLSMDMKAMYIYADIQKRLDDDRRRAEDARYRPSYRPYGDF